MISCLLLSFFSAGLHINELKKTLLCAYKGMKMSHMLREPVVDLFCVLANGIIATSVNITKCKLQKCLTDESPADNYTLYWTLP